MAKKERNEEKEEELFKEFDIEVKKDLVSIINDSPSLVRLDNREYRVKNMRYYSLYRICNVVMVMRENDKDLDNDNKILTALCTDISSMCEIMAIILCNHLFTPDDVSDEEELMSRNDKLILRMKAKIMNSVYDPNQWAAIILGAIKSIDLSGFFLLKKSVSTVTDSLLNRKKKSVEIASQFSEAQSLAMQQTSSERSRNTD